MVLLISAAIIVCRSTASTTTTGPIYLCVQHLVVGVRARRRTRVVLPYKEHRLEVEERRWLLPRAYIYLNRPVFESAPSHLRPPSRWWSRVSRRSPWSLWCSQLPAYLFFRWCWDPVWVATNRLWCWRQRPYSGSPMHPSVNLHPLSRAFDREHMRQSNIRLSLLIAPKLGSLCVLSLVVPRPVLQTLVDLNSRLLRVAP